MKNKTLKLTDFKIKSFVTCSYSYNYNVYDITETPIPPTGQCSIVCTPVCQTAGCTESC